MLLGSRTVGMRGDGGVPRPPRAGRLEGSLPTAMINFVDYFCLFYFVAPSSQAPDTGFSKWVTPAWCSAANYRPCTPRSSTARQPPPTDLHTLVIHLAVSCLLPTTFCGRFFARFLAGVTRVARSSSSTSSKWPSRGRPVLNCSTATEIVAKVRRTGEGTRGVDLHLVRASRYCSLGLLFPTW